MQILGIALTGLRRLIEDGDPRGVPSDVVPTRVRMVSYLQSMESVDELSSIPHWNAHRLEGRHADTWRLTVTRKFRLALRATASLDIVDLDYEEYH